MFLLTVGRAWQSKHLHPPIPCGFDGDAGGRHIATLEWSKSKLKLPKRELLGDFAMESRWRRCDHTCTLRRRNTVCSMLFHPVRTEMPRTNAKASHQDQADLLHATGQLVSAIDLLPPASNRTLFLFSWKGWALRDHSVALAPISLNPSKVAAASLCAVRMSWQRLSTLACRPSVALRLPGAREGQAQRNRDRTRRTGMPCIRLAV